MHELLNTKTGKITQFAEDIHELTPEQYLFYLDLVLQNMVGEITDPQIIKRKLFSKLCDVKVSWRMNFYSKETYEAIWSALTDKINLLDSFFDITEDEQGKETFQLHVKCTGNLLPTWKKYKGPENLLMDITWGQFKQCVNALKLMQYARQNEDVQDIERFTKDIFHALYKSAPNPLKGAKEIPDTVQFHALTYFSYWYELITTYPIEINGEEIDFSVLWKSDDDEVSNEMDKSGWMGITFSIAESGVFGDTEDVDNEKLYKVLMFLYKNKVTQIFEKKQQKKQNNDQSE